LNSRETSGQSFEQETKSGKSAVGSKMISKQSEQIQNQGRKAAVVSGASRGIGAAIAAELHANGWRVIGTATETQRPELEGCAFVDEWWRVNLENPGDRDELQERLLGTSRLGAFVNNAGINIIKPHADVTEKDYVKIQSVNLHGPYFAARAAAMKMAQDGGGRIVNIASIWSVVSKEWRTLYSTMKTGLVGMTRSMAVEWASRGVLVNAVSPGFTMTDLTRQSLSEEQLRSIEQVIPMKRLAEPVEIAKVVAFLCSDDNSYLTGQNLVVDGGFTNV
jgi:3-oxoacyl-[acyl-carrier protein] reductase